MRKAPQTTQEEKESYLMRLGPKDGGKRKRGRRENNHHAQSDLLVRE